MRTADDVRRIMKKDASGRSYAKHLVTARDKWYAEAVAREELERGGATSSEWSQRARLHADKLNKELESILAKVK